MWLLAVNLILVWLAVAATLRVKYDTVYYYCIVQMTILQLSELVNWPSLLKLIFIKQSPVVSVV